jgi:hypothetical protein
MRAVTVRQPWAWAIARGHQEILNCGWETGFRGEIAIHASLRVDLEAFDRAVIRSANWDPGDPEAAIGGIVAVLSLVSVCDAALAGGPCDCGEWAVPGSFHWRLAQPRPLAWPVLTIGQPGLWDLPARVAADVARLLPGQEAGDPVSRRGPAR